jgi:hypothetical protein
MAERYGPAAGSSQRVAGAREASTEQYELIRSDSHLDEEEKTRIVDYVVTRYQSNVRVTLLLCQGFGVRCLFVWQPHAAYKYNRNLHKRFPFEGEVPDYFRRVYERMESARASDFLNLADLAHEVSVDDVCTTTSA